MKNKYYTPELEEFYVGFEFEEFYNDQWNSKVYISGYFLNYNMDCLFGKDKDKIRVKYLDREDIESLGWKFEEECPTWISFNMSGEKNLTLYKESKKVEILIPDNPLQYHYSFAGTIKNKSELKKLLKQLGI